MLWNKKEYFIQDLVKTAVHCEQLHRSIVTCTKTATRQVGVWPILIYKKRVGYVAVLTWLNEYIGFTFVIVLIFSYTSLVTQSSIQHIKKWEWLQNRHGWQHCLLFIWKQTLPCVSIFLIQPEKALFIATFIYLHVYISSLLLCYNVLAWLTCIVGSWSFTQLHGHVGKLGQNMPNNLSCGE